MNSTATRSTTKAQRKNTRPVAMVVAMVVVLEMVTKLFLMSDRPDEETVKNATLLYDFVTLRRK